MSKPRRVRPPGRLKDLSDQLIENGPFESKQKALMFAASVGVQLGKREPLSSSGVAIRWNIFERNGDDTFIYALAIAEVEDLVILSNEIDESEDFITIFEEYANAGLKHLEDRVLNTPGSLVDELIQFILSIQRSSEEAPPGLEGLTQEDLDMLGL